MDLFKRSKQKWTFLVQVAIMTSRGEILKNMGKMIISTVCLLIFGWGVNEQSLMVQADSDVTRSDTDPTLQAGDVSTRDAGTGDISTDGTTGSTNVTVTFINGSIYIVQMPNFDFGTGHDYRDTSFNLNSPSSNKKIDRSLIVNSPDSAVGFYVSVANYGSKLVYSDQKNIDTAQNLISSVTNTGSTDVGYLALDSSVNTNPVQTETSLDGTGKTTVSAGYSYGNNSNVGALESAIPLTSANSAKSLKVLDATSGFQGYICLAFVDPASATLTFAPNVLKNMQDNLLSHNSEHNSATFIFPLHWTANLNNVNEIANEQM